jgi:hypothetical protein
MRQYRASAVRAPLQFRCSRRVGVYHANRTGPSLTSMDYTIANPLCRAEDLRIRRPPGLRYAAPA